MDKDIDIERVKVSARLKVIISTTASLILIVFTVAMVYSDLNNKDAKLEEKIDKKVDREEFNKQKFIDSVKNNETNRKLGLIMEWLKIPDYGQEPKK
jgi:low affinity Fe/Cu permease